ncbi:hypothetical protein ACJRO7_014571 [Eucalyptus globulus]|uniref:Uncharacterized protein n=1 Tax=Eucalyptus globulus TaxID=34317 RepID=A0ABD3LB72_EUCGL
MPFKHELKSSSPRLLLCCFRDATVHDEAASSNYNDDDDGDGNDSYHRVAQSPCSWLRSTARELPLLKIRHKLQSLITQIKRYDLMSYALNFEGDWGQESDEESPARNFTTRLPVSPDRLLSNAEGSRSM